MDARGECAPRRVGDVALVVTHRPERLRYLQLDRRARARQGRAGPRRGPRRPAAVWSDGKRADGVGRSRGHRARPRQRPGVPGHRRRAPGARRRRAARAPVDHRPGADAAAVNVFFHTFGCRANQY
ncbi:MAG: hypothetical protein DMD49_06600, partial [Gemmatimonadetes bacterium]